MDYVFAFEEKTTKSTPREMLSILKEGKGYCMSGIVDIMFFCWRSCGVYAEIYQGCDLARNLFRHKGVRKSPEERLQI